MKVRWVVICQHCRLCLAPLCSDAVLYISHHNCARGKVCSEPSWEPVWNDCGAPLTFVFAFRETWGRVGDGLGACSKIWQIAENCLHTVIPVWTHLAHLVVIWQQKCSGGGLSSQSGATYYPHSSLPPPPPLFWFGLQTYWWSPPPLFSLCGALGADGALSWYLAVVPPEHSWAPLWLFKGISGL